MCLSLVACGGEEAADEELTVTAETLERLSCLMAATRWSLKCGIQPVTMHIRTLLPLTALKVKSGRRCTAFDERGKTLVPIHRKPHMKERQENGCLVSSDRKAPVLFLRPYREKGA